MPFLPPLFTAACHTGARLSELTRSEADDWDFAGRVVLIREKKRSRLGVTYCRVPMSDRLAATMRTWFGRHHPGGRLAFCGHPDAPPNSQHLTQNLDKFTRTSEWRVPRGWHTFRHSFASNLARAGVDERVVDELMGYQTEEMTKRYRHFLPGQRADAVRKLLG